jgi:signal transduction histidine kinase
LERSSCGSLRKFVGYFALSLTFFLPVSLSRSAEVQEQHNILILNSYNWGFPWTDGQVAGLIQGFSESNEDVVLTIEQLDVIGRKAFDARTYADHLKWQYGHKKYALIVVTDTAALRFVAAQYDTMFKGLPVVFSDVADLEKIDLPPGMPVTGVREHTDFMSTIDLARKLRPDAREIFVFGNARENGSGPRTAQSFLADLELDIPVTVFLDRPLEEMLDIAAGFDPRDIVINLSYSLDEAGKTHDYQDTSAKVSAASSAPLFYFWSTSVRHGAMVGGKVSDPFLQGYTAAGLALRVLGGERPQDIPTLVAPTRYLFHHPQLRRHGIGLGALPAGSEILERPPSIYKDYKELVWGTFALMSLLVIVIFVLLTAMRIRRQAEADLAAARDHLEEQVGQRTAELVAANDTLNSTLTTLKDAQNQLVESEKMAALGGLVSGVAHEINTPLGVSITAASSLEEEARHIGEDYRNRKLSQSRFERFIETATQTSGILMANLERAAGLVRSFKQVAVDQTTNILRRVDLKSYLTSTVDSLSPELKQGRHRVEVDCPEDLVIETYPGIIAQIVTNFVVNSVRHGFGENKRSGLIRIRVVRQENGIELFYDDDGKGMRKDVLKRAFDPFFTTARKQGGTGLGLSIVYNLVTHKLGGRIDCRSAPGEGVHFTLFLPDQIAGETRVAVGQ